MTQSKDLKEDQRYVLRGSSEGLNYFEGGDYTVVRAFDERGMLKETYEFPKWLKYKGQKLYDHQAVLWNGKPYYIAKSPYSKKEPTIHVMFKLHEDREVTEEDGIISGLYKL